MTQKIKKRFFSLANLVRIGSAGIVTWLMNACGVGLITGNQPGSAAGGVPQFSIAYLDSTQSNNPAPLNTVSAGLGVGLFNLRDVNCDAATGQAVDYVFRITNNGIGPLTAPSVSPVSVTLLNTATNPPVGGYWNPDPYGDLGSYTFAVTTQPTFPIAPGQSSNFIVHFNYNADGNNPGGYVFSDLVNSTCTFRWVDGVNGISPYGVVQFHLAIQTNDPTQGNFSTDLSIWGQS